MHRTRWSHITSSCLFVFLASGLFAPGAYCEDVIFAFDVAGVLPSSQGAVLYLHAYEDVPVPPKETDIFSVSGGLLRQDTTRWGYATDAGYQVPDVFDHSENAVLEFSAKLLYTTHWPLYGAFVSLSSANRYWEIDLTENGVSIYYPDYNDHWIPFNTTDDFHVYRLEIPANQDVADFYIDGQKVYTAAGAVIPVGYPGALGWGDGSPTGGNAAIEWDYISLSNHSAPLSVDIKPGSCPNALSVSDKGAVTVAVAGRPDFDVSLVDPSSLVLTRPDRPGVPPLRWSYADVATPYEGEACGCHDLGADGILDLVLKFGAQQLVTTLALPSTKGYVTLTLEGILDPEAGGTAVEGADCLKIVR